MNSIWCALFRVCTLCCMNTMSSFRVCTSYCMSTMSSFRVYTSYCINERYPNSPRANHIGWRLHPEPKYLRRKVSLTRKTLKLLRQASLFGRGQTLLTWHRIWMTLAKRKHVSQPRNRCTLTWIRKSISDLYGSLNSGRLHTQVQTIGDRFIDWLIRQAWVYAVSVPTHYLYTHTHIYIRTHICGEGTTKWSLVRCSMQSPHYCPSCRQHQWPGITDIRFSSLSSRWTSLSVSICQSCTATSRWEWPLCIALCLQL